MRLKEESIESWKKTSKMWYFLPQHHHTSLQDDESWTPLHSSASRGSSGVVAELVKASCDVDAATSSGATGHAFCCFQRAWGYFTTTGDCRWRSERWVEVSYARLEKWLMQGVLLRTYSEILISHQLALPFYSRVFWFHCGIIHVRNGAFTVHPPTRSLSPSPFTHISRQKKTWSPIDSVDGSEIRLTSWVR